MHIIKKLKIDSQGLELKNRISQEKYHPMLKWQTEVHNAIHLRPVSSPFTASEVASHTPIGKL